MSVYFEFECDRCELQGGRLDRYAGDRWDADLIGTMKFFIHHLRTCSPLAFTVRSDMGDDGEYGTRPDTDFVPATVGTFPLSDDWEAVAGATDIEKFDAAWSEEMQQMLTDDASEEE